MGHCACCGNQYDKLITVTMADESYSFDCFECAIQILAPACESCGVKIIGHGAETLGGIYCSAHCARALGEIKLRDRSNELSF